MARFLIVKLRKACENTILSRIILGVGYELFRAIVG